MGTASLCLQTVKVCREQTDRWTDRETDRQTDRQINRYRFPLTPNLTLFHLISRPGHTNIDQSILRSFIGLQDTGQLLQLAANPLILQTQVTITRFLYQKHFLTLTITVNRQQQPVKMRIMAIQADNKQAIRPLFACEAGCKSDPTELKP